MASTLPFWVFLLLVGVLLSILVVGLPGRPTPSGKRGIGGVLTGSVRTAVTGGFLWAFLEVGILSILWGSTTLLLVGDAVSIASKFLTCFILVGSVTNISL